MNGCFIVQLVRAREVYEWMCQGDLNSRLKMTHLDPQVVCLLGFIKEKEKSHY